RPASADRRGAEAPIAAAFARAGERVLGRGGGRGGPRVGARRSSDRSLRDGAGREPNEYGGAEERRSDHGDRGARGRGFYCAGAKTKGRRRAIDARRRLRTRAGQLTVIRHPSPSFATRRMTDDE